MNNEETALELHRLAAKAELESRLIEGFTPDELHERARHLLSAERAAKPGPRWVHTDEGLANLESGAVIRDAEGRVLERDSGRWFWGEAPAWPPALPAQVLDLPDGGAAMVAAELRRQADESPDPQGCGPTRLRRRADVRGRRRLSTDPNRPRNSGRPVVRSGQARPRASAHAGTKRGTMTTLRARAGAVLAGLAITATGIFLGGWNAEWWDPTPVTYHQIGGTPPRGAP